MRILVTNDDGIKHPNIKILVETLLKYFNKEDITVVAPAVEQSADITPANDSNIWKVSIP